MERGTAGRKSGDWFEMAACFVKEVEHAIGDCKECTSQAQAAVLFLFPYAGEGAEILKADPDACLLHRTFGSASLGAQLARDRFTRFIQQSDPVRDEATFAGLCTVQFLGQSGLATATHAMTENNNFLDLQDLDCKFQRRGNAMVPRRRFERRHHRRNVADDEDFSRINVEDLRRIHAAVGTGNDHDLWLLPLSQRGPTFTAWSPPGFAKATIAFDQASKF